MLRVASTLAVLILAAAVVLGWYRHMPSLEDTRWRVLLTLLGVACGAWVLRPLVAGVHKAPLAAYAGLAAVILSQACFYVIVWTPFKSHGVLWRAWWITLVCAVTAAHLVWIRFLAGGPLIGPNRGRLPSWVVALARITCAAIALAAVQFAALALGSTPIPEVSTARLIALATPASGAVIGTIILAVRASRLRRRVFPLWTKLAWAAASLAVVFGVGFYAGRVTAPAATALESMPSALAHLSNAELSAQLDVDLRRLKIVAAGLDDLTARTDVVHSQLRALRSAEKRDWYHPAEEDQIRAAFMSYLAYRAALLRMAATYADYPAIADPQLRARAFLVGAAAGASVYRASLHLVTTYRDEEPARKKLDEPDPNCGIAANTFERIYQAVTDTRNTAKIEEMAAYFAQKRDAWRNAGIAGTEDFDWLDRRIEQSMTDIRASGVNPTRAVLEQIVRRVKDDAYTPVYATQSVISTLIGDTRMVSRPPFISDAQVAQMRGMLKPGDILLERRNWFMSNAFLPGFWPHGALYVGDVHDLERLGLVHRDARGKWTSDIAAVRDHLDEYLKPAEDGMPHTIVESVSEGVIFNSLTESMSADYVAVLRPHKLTDAQKAEAIARAFSHAGKPYDFEFDFFSADKLVCTELVYRSYDGLLHFELVPIMGRSTLPALEIARKFSTERTRDDRELDFVMFLDAVPERNSARFATEDDFCATIHRPRGFNE
jgi:hypothetical protein